ncbi:hypothetical protein PSTG_14294 [Puccinia striiformis f. sp. tritici PST-78]|uniref:Phosphoglycerate mutase n=1 Tax=Puccinia striiformis f. sp. tritici PST-78 TaxID=1165861 RepID=A0A0L0UZI6_9BASI|nr:hypothetical protein PSTG_14294 [Puccinia striiformis f. sp. tritici PST-78]
MLVTLIRHGQTDDNRNQIIQGHKDTPLNGLGIQQAIQTGKFLHQSQIRFDQIWSSDLQRAQKTASLISEQIDQPPSIQIDQRLRERFLGDLEGKPREHRDKRVNSKSAEPAHSVLSRLLEFWNQVIINSPSHHHILILSHGGALRSLIESGLIHSLKYHTPSDYINDPTFANCSITTVEIDSSDHNKIIQIANVDHLTHNNLNPDMINPDEMN